MVRVNEIGKLPDFGPEVVEVHLCFVEMGACVCVCDYISADGTYVESRVQSTCRLVVSTKDLIKEAGLHHLSTSDEGQQMDA